MLRVVLDTNVYISAALHGRQAETALELASAGRMALITSPVLLAELEEKLRDKLLWNADRVGLFLTTVRDLADVVEPDFRLSIVPDDDDDNRVLECAVAAQADLIVTFDRDLLRLRTHESIGIISPRELTFYP